MQETSSGKVLIIGAGPAGLSAAASLKALGVDFDLVDSQNHVGGVWNVANDDAPSWPSQRLTSSKNNTQFDDLRMPVGFDSFPSADEYATYLRAYASHHGLTENFYPRTSVRLLRDFGEGQWEAELSNGQVRPYAAVIAAHGVANRPFLPPLFFEAKDTGSRTIHVKNFAGAEATEEQSVLVVGSGQSAADVATELADDNRRVALHLTEGHWVVPRSIAGVPADSIAQAEPGILGRKFNDSVAEKIVTKLMGRPEEVGLPAPDKALLDDEPIVSDSLIEHIREHRIMVIKDGRHLPFESFDLVVFATGYEPGADYFPAEYANDLFLGAFPRSRNDFAVLGQVRVAGGVVPVLTQQADIAVYAIHAFLTGNTAVLSKFSALKAQSESTVAKSPRSTIATGSGVRGKARGLASQLRTAAHRPRIDAPAEGWTREADVDDLPEDKALKLPMTDRGDLLARLHTTRRVFEKKK